MDGGVGSVHRPDLQAVERDRVFLENGQDNCFLAQAADGEVSQVEDD